MEDTVKLIHQSTAPLSTNSKAGSIGSGGSILSSRSSGIAGSQQLHASNAADRGNEGGRVWKSVRFVSEAEEMNPTCRNTMEDSHRAVDSFGGVEDQGYFAVYDGHGGRGVVDHVNEMLEKNLITELKYNQNANVVESLISAFLITDIQSARKNLMVSGSTAACCLVRKEGNGSRVVYAANVGDSRAVISRNGVAHRLTFDHKASESAEVRRVESAGGFIMRKRVLGILSVTRSFGDHSMKKYILARPYTSRTEIRNEDKYLIIACDGVWDVLSDQEAVDLVHEYAHESRKLSEMAAMLVAESISRGSTDNVTALVIEL